MSPQNEELLSNLRAFDSGLLGELGLLLELLSEHGTPKEIVIRSMLERAARFDHVLQPRLSSWFAAEFKFVRESEGLVLPTDLGRRMAMLCPVPSRNRLTHAQCQLLVPELVCHPDLREYFAAAMGTMAASADAVLVYHVGTRRLDEGQQLAFRLLQMLGCCRSSPKCIEMDEAEARRIRILTGVINPPSEEELWESMLERSLRGKAAEEYVAEYERRRLKAAGRDDLAGFVERVSEKDPGAGFDIRSFDVDGTARYVEVKSTLSMNVVFYWSSSEMRFAERNGAAYWIYVVLRSQELVDAPLEPIKMQNPIALVGSELQLEAVDYLVRRM